MIEIANHLAGIGLRLGVVEAHGVQPDVYPAGFEEVLDEVLRRRQTDPIDELRRSAVRDMLRNGRYRPTGRGKPASEYLIRAATEGFPRINAPVDVCNLISLSSLLPISLWDVGLAGADSYFFRLGTPGEAYVFNAAGQTIDLEDLIVGCRTGPELPPQGMPIVNPVKDSLATKTTGHTRHVAAIIYAPSAAVPEDELIETTARFADLLASCGPEAAAAYRIVD